MANKQITIFKVGDDILGIDIGEVKEIISPQQVFKVPDTPEFIEGIINIRDVVYTLINLRIKYKLPPKEYDENTKILVVNSDISPFAFLVDQANEIVWIDEVDIDTTPEKLKQFESKNISGIVSLENKTILILDINQLINQILE